MNPIFGSCLSFAVFVDDSKAEAISIWILELGSVILEFLTYINLRKLYAREERRLEKLTSSISSYKRDVRERDSELQEMSVKDEYRKNYYLRERRNLRVEHSASQRKLRYHFIGVCVNFTLLGLTLLLIILVARGGGMCKVGGEGLDLFNTDQKGRCNMCIEQLKGEKCELCKDRAEDQVPSEADLTFSRPKDRLIRLIIIITYTLTSNQNNEESNRNKEQYFVIVVCGPANLTCRVHGSYWIVRPKLDTNTTFVKPNRKFVRLW